MTVRQTRGPGRPSASGPMPPSGDQILRQGLEAFVELGYDGASMRELANRLDVSHNFINDRYGSKQAFWRAVADYALEGATGVLTAALESSDDDEERLTAIVRRFYQVAVRMPQLNQLMLEESHLRSERLDYVFERYVAPLISSIEPSVRRMVAAGRLPDIPMYLLYSAVIGPAAALTRRPMVERLGWPSHPDEADLTAIAEDLARLALNGLLGRPGSRTEPPH
ncbi:TetR/AcrR family transcriptional regulator [Streptomyces sp. NPDC087263]|uniref:TetR/AcrR family transcriptional regulator n=1 Tax=Streptomyces sp. NPDC087263 TaxID=3365773 RepID=UPI00382E61F3